jgi:adenosylcobinamide-GDP ribazoletransferase
VNFFTALQFLTCIPVLKHGETTPEKIGRATAYFPVIGLLIGIALATLNWLLGYLLPTAVVPALLIVALALITGAMHLDGLADTCDGLAGHKPVEERWQIMHDSRTGAFGVVGIVLVLLVKYAALSSLPQPLLTPNLIFFPVLSRWVMVYAIFAHPYARPEGLGITFKSNTRWPQFTVATIITLGIAITLFPVFSFTGLLLMPAVWAVSALFSIYLTRKFAGLTGDTYGAINEIAEVTTLLIASLIYSVAWYLR